MDDYARMSLTDLRKHPLYKMLPRSIGKSSMSREQLIESFRYATLDPHMMPSSSKRFTRSTAQYVCQPSYALSQEELRDTLQETLKHYYVSGVRSSKKLDVLHLFINCVIRQTLKEMAPDYYKYITVDSQPIREIKVDGLMYNKDVDITVSYKSNHVGIVSVKFIMSNYAQNANNYFENLIGESVNLKASKRPRVFWYSLFSFDKIPYYNRKNDIERYEKLYITKYKSLQQVSSKYAVLPDCISITLIKNKQGTLKHPDKITDKNMHAIEQLVAEVMNNDIESKEPFSFYVKLHEFCKLVIDTIDKHYATKGRLPVASASL